ncbi:MAG TPA: hypothetical protein VGO93_30910, partial [Candidatus Xenobia bacterium]
DSEHSSSAATGSNQSDLEASRGFFHGTRVSGSSSASFSSVSSHDREASGVSQPELIDALGRLQTLGDRMGNLRAYPSSTVSIMGSQNVQETVDVDRTTQPQAPPVGRLARLMGKEPEAPPAQVSHLTVDANLAESRDGYRDTSGTLTRTLGSVPFIPAYFDTPDA